MLVGSRGSWRVVGHPEVMAAIGSPGITFETVGWKVHAAQQVLEARIESAIASSRPCLLNGALRNSERIGNAEVIR
jgi:hypothetical protein